MTRGESSRARGEENSQRILAALKGRSLSVRELAAELGLSESGVTLQLRKLSMCEPRRAYVCRHFLTPGSRGQPTPFWTAGSKDHVEYVRINIPGRKKTAAERRAQILALLTERPRTMAQLAEAIHIVRESVGKHMRKLRDPSNKQVYIKKWNHPSKIVEEGIGGDWAPVYAVGDKKDAKKPVETSSQRHKRVYADPNYRAAVSKRRKQHYQIEKLRKKPAGIFAALGL